MLVAASAFTVSSSSLAVKQLACFGRSLFAAVRLETVYQLACCLFSNQAIGLLARFQPRNCPELA